MTPALSSIPADPHARREAFADLASGVIFVALATGLAVAHFSQTGRLHADFGADPGPAMLPRILLLVLAVAGLLLLLRGGLALRAPARNAAPRQDSSGGSPAPVPADAKDNLIRVFAALVILAAFQPLLVAIGAGVALSVLGAALAVLAVWEHRRPTLGLLVRAAVEGALIALALYAVFRLVLGVPLQ